MADPIKLTYDALDVPVGPMKLNVQTTSFDLVAPDVMEALGSLDWITSYRVELPALLQWETFKPLEQYGYLSWVSSYGHRFMPDIINHSVYLDQPSISSRSILFGVSSCIASYSINFQNTGISDQTTIEIYAGGILQKTLEIESGQTEYKIVGYVAADQLFYPEETLEIRISEVADQSSGLAVNIFAISFPFDLEVSNRKNIKNDRVFKGVQNALFSSSDEWVLEFNQPIQSITSVVLRDKDGTEHALTSALSTGHFFNNTLSIQPIAGTLVDTVVITATDYAGNIHTLQLDGPFLDDVIVLPYFMQNSEHSIRTGVECNLSRYSLDGGTTWSTLQAVTNNTLELDFTGAEAGEYSILIGLITPYGTLTYSSSIYIVVGEPDVRISFKGERVYVHYDDLVPISKVAVYTGTTLINSFFITSASGFETASVDNQTGELSISAGTLYYENIRYDYSGDSISLSHVDKTTTGGFRYALLVFGFNLYTKEFEVQVQSASGPVSKRSVPNIDGFINIRVFNAQIHFPITPTPPNSPVFDTTENHLYIFDDNFFDFKLEEGATYAITVEDVAGRVKTFTYDFTKTFYNIWRYLAIYNSDKTQEILPGQIHQNETLLGVFTSDVSLEEEVIDE